MYSKCMLAAKNCCLAADCLYVTLWPDEISSTKLIYWWNLLLFVARRSEAYANPVVCIVL